VAGLENVVQVAAGQYTGVAIKTDGHLVVWGGRGDEPLPLTEIPGLDQVVSVTIQFRIVALRADGTVWVVEPRKREASRLGGLDNVAAVTSLGGLVIATRRDGTIWFFGQDWQQLPGIGDARAAGIVSPRYGGPSTVFALKADGSVWMLRDGAPGNASWTPVAGLTGVRAISQGLGGYFLYALKTDGTAWTIGSDGKVGQIPGLSDIVAISSNEDEARPNIESAYTLAVRSDGTAWALGSNFWGTLGLPETPDVCGETGGMANLPIRCAKTWTQIPSVTGARSIAAGGRFALAVVDP
jgi:alpha-tubulin suppressor-like RCC1 family protein